MTDLQTCETDAAPEQPASGGERRAVSVAARTAVGVATGGLLVVLLVLDSFWPQGLLFAGVGTLVTALALREYAGLCGQLGIAVSARFLVLAGCALFLVHWAGLARPSLFPDPWLCAMLVIVSAVAGTLSRRALEARVRGSLAEASAVALGLAYVPMMLAFLMAIRLRWGLADAVLLLAVCKGSSSAAYFTGKAIGRRRMAPVVSPNKTYEGLFGSFVAGMAIPLVASVAGWAPLDIPQALAFGFVVWAAATVGDLAASLLKRDAGLKDSGEMLPGLGGMIDMADEILFAAPFGYLVLAAFRGLA